MDLEVAVLRLRIPRAVCLPYDNNICGPRQGIPWRTYVSNALPRIPSCKPATTPYEIKSKGVPRFAGTAGRAARNAAGKIFVRKGKEGCLVHRFPVN